MQFEERFPGCSALTAWQLLDFLHGVMGGCRGIAETVDRQIDRQVDG